MTLKISVSLLLFLLQACASIQPNHQDLALQPYAPGIVIVSEPVGKGYYAVLEKRNERWQIIGSLSTNPISRISNNQEILFVNHRLRSIAPVYDRRLNTHGAHCTPILDSNDWYWLCTSQFSSIDIGLTIGRNIVSCALTFCLAAGSHVQLDHEKVQEAVLESGLIDRVKAQIALGNRPISNRVDYEAESQYRELHRIFDHLKAIQNTR